MKFSDKALSRISLALLRIDTTDASRKHPTPSPPMTATASLRSLRSAAAGRRREATVLTFKKRRR
jgi:hypothetical protein